MALNVPNLPKLTQQSPELGEALQAVQTYTNLNVTAKTGTRVAPPPKSLANPSKSP